MNRVWTEEELDILRRDRAEKVPVPVTAAKLGRPVPATYARARLIGTLVQQHQPWDEASVIRLRDLVLNDPPMTDKRIAAELGRTVTQIRWKMQDLGLIGVRDLSKLAKVTASETVRPKTVKNQSAGLQPSKAAPRKPPSDQPVCGGASLQVHIDMPAPSAFVKAAAPQEDLQAALMRALKSLEQDMTSRLKNSVSASETGMIQAARAAIAEKARIDQRLLVRVKRSAEAAARRSAEAQTVEIEAKRQEAEVRKAEAEAKRKAAEAARQRRSQKALAEKAQSALPKTAAKLPAVQSVSQVAAPASLPPAPVLPKIVVTEAPAALRPPEPDLSSAQTSGRGGWKSVRRDPARTLAQSKAKAKPANRADAVDLAQAAQAAIERFIAERGVTRNEAGGIQLVVSRLQARGYIVVRDDDGWTIDQRHRVDSEADLVAFAEARGIILSAAA
jgi:hypothetical protein